MIGLIMVLAWVASFVLVFLALWLHAGRPETGVVRRRKP